MIELPSNVESGLDLIPHGLRYPDDEAWLTIYLSRDDAIQDVIVELWNQLLTWPLPQAQLWTWLLEAIGALLGQARPNGADDETYRRVLVVRRLSRISNGTQPAVRRVVKVLGDLGSGASVRFVIPHTIVVAFSNFSELEALGFTVEIVSDILLDSIGPVDRLQMFDAVGNVFTWDVEGAGWLQGVWATPLFDSKDF